MYEVIAKITLMLFVEVMQTKYYPYIMVGEL